MRLAHPSSGRYYALVDGELRSRPRRWHGRNRSAVLTAVAENSSAGLSTILSRANDFRPESLSRFAPAPLSQTLRHFSAGNVDSPSDGSGQGAIANQQPFGQRDRVWTWLFAATRSNPRVS